MTIYQTKKQTGNKGEELACKFLHNLGYKIIERNYRIRGGEIDIVCQDKDILVFIEVKARFNHEYGLPSEAITQNKLKALKKSALFYIQKINWGNKQYRFDFVGIDYTNSKNNPSIELIKNITS